MDSVTQIALGAAVGEAVLGRKVGRKALLWGGFCGLFPDLDVLVPLGDAVRNFTYHRSASHSLFVLTLLTPLFTALILRFHPQTAPLRLRWTGLVWLAFATHALLDCFTVYGTQILWPLSTPPVMWSTIFIIDPAYSIPLFTGVLAALILTRNTDRGHLFNTVGLVLSTLYLAGTVAAKSHVSGVVVRSLAQHGLTPERVLTVPTPFNAVLWRVVALDGEEYVEGFYSLLDEDPRIAFRRHPNNHRLLDGLEDHWPVRRLRWFTHGFYAVDDAGGAIVMTDLRMGAEPHYVFRFQVGVSDADSAGPRPTVGSRVPGGPRAEQLRWVWQRIWGRAKA